MAVDARNYHIQYPGVTNQHWHPESGKYAGGDHLMTALQDGWEIQQCIQINHTYDGMRGVTVYEFKLERAGETMVMPVINNPYVERFLYSNDLAIVVKKANGEEAA